MTQEPFFTPDAYVSVSRATIWGLALGLVFFTGFAMTLCMKVDFPLFLAEREMALKVGGTIIDLPTFRELKSAAEIDRESVSDQAFASELLELLLLAEAGRKANLDRDPVFQKRIHDYDEAMAEASGTQVFYRTLFLFEELAERAREHLAGRGGEQKIDLASAPALVSQPPRLRVSEILVKTPDEAKQILSEASTGVSFSQLNASWSRSPYAGVGGDRGWNDSRDFPEGVFGRLLETPIGSVTFGFSDDQGTRLFMVQAHPTSEIQDQAERYADFWRRQALRKAQHRLLEQLRVEIPHYIHPQFLPGDQQTNP